jgi:hydrogenase-4 transcriptional activator
MERFREVLLLVWREACRHIECQVSTAAIFELLANHLPVNCLLLRRLDGQHSSLETVARGGNDQEELRPHTPLNAAELKRLIAWAKHGEVASDERRDRRGIAALVTPPELEGPVLIAPLAGVEGPAGVLALLAAPHKSFKPMHLQMAQALVEPFSAVLENDRRLHELAALREAAEADRRTLLSRLGRQEMHEPIVGADSGLRLVMERVNLVAQSDAPVLILGDTGTGKEIISRAIHGRSPRQAAPFIRVNCGAIPSELIDSQLFGHERGSFTGAGDMRKGWFERADGGTLFLDEIGELPLHAQVRLLRVLQDGYIERVGGQQPIRVDVRIVAATHRNLATMVKSGGFREDLWYRINVFPILMPRLRERIEDIPALTRHFAQRAAHRFGLAYVEPTPLDLATLADYQWPGNIRELGAVVDRAVILGNGERLEVSKALGADALDRSAASAPEPGDDRYDSPSGGAAPQGATRSFATLDTAMKKHIEQALETTGGKVEGPGGAAELLGINPHTLRARMRKLKIDWSRYRNRRS